jgi:transcriptional regulator GlxA family with amidase domain
VLAIRSGFGRSATAPRWYRASTDPRLNATLQAMHENAAHPWSVPELAAAARAGADPANGPHVP